LGNPLLWEAFYSSCRVGGTVRSSVVWSWPRKGIKIFGGVTGLRFKCFRDSARSGGEQ